MAVQSAGACFLVSIATIFHIDDSPGPPIQKAFSTAFVSPRHQPWHFTSKNGTSIQLFAFDNSHGDE
jgi:hypothetical protein